MTGKSLETIGRYQIVDRVGEGASGDVYRCFDPILKREVAVKVPQAGLDSDGLKSVVQAFYHEAEVGAQFHHANIVMVYDVGGNLPDDDQPADDIRSHYLVMELANGVNLKDYLQQHGRLPVRETLEIVFECCKALDYIHYQGILHRDIKPANILYDAHSKQLKITDFSLSEYEDNATDRQVGTLPYSSPEHFIAGRNITFQTDLFALGSVMYQLLTGVCPFQGSSVDEVASNIVSTHPRPVREYRDDVPTQVEFILAKAMSKRVRDRFQSAVEFTDAVSMALKTMGVVQQNQVDVHRKNTAIDEYLLLRNNSWFNEFSPDQIDELVRSGRVLSYDAEEYILREGEIADSFYTLLEGEAVVVQGGQLLNELKPGACFGELGHLTRAKKHTASIRAKIPVRVLAVETEKLLGLSSDSQAGFYKAFLTITIERLVEKNLQLIGAD